MLPLIVTAVFLVQGIEKADPALAQLQGKWVRLHHMHEGKKRELVLEFKGEMLKWYIQEEGKPWHVWELPFTLETERSGPGSVDANRFVLRDHRTKFAIYFHVDDDKLTLVGGLAGRAYWMLSLSGTYTKVTPGK